MLFVKPVAILAGHAIDGQRNAETNLLDMFWVLVLLPGVTANVVLELVLRVPHCGENRIILAL